MKYDYQRLRKDLKEECLAAMYNGAPVAVMDLTDVELASESELPRLAKRLGLALHSYEVEDEEEVIF